MKILCMTFAGCQVGAESLMPLELLASVADMLDAGHQVHWFEEAVGDDNWQRLVERAQAIDPDVVFFCCQSRRLQPLMATIAFSTGSVLGNDYIAPGQLAPLSTWREMIRVAQADAKRADAPASGGVHAVVTQAG